MITLGEIAVLAFVAYRGTRLLVHDDIAEPARGLVYTWHARRHQSRARQAAVTLVTCPYCMGVWVSAATVAVWIAVTAATWPGTLPFLLDVLAVAGGQALLNRWDDTRDHDHDGDGS